MEDEEPGFVAEHAPEYSVREIDRPSTDEVPPAADGRQCIVEVLRVAGVEVWIQPILEVEPVGA